MSFIFSDIRSVKSPSSCLYIAAYVSGKAHYLCSLWYLLLHSDTTPFICLLDGKVCVSAKGVETLDFLFRAVGVFGSMACMGRVEREVLVRVMYCSSVRLKNKSM